VSVSTPWTVGLRPTHRAETVRSCDPVPADWAPAAQGAAASCRVRRTGVKPTTIVVVCGITPRSGHVTNSPDASARGTQQRSCVSGRAAGAAGRRASRLGCGHHRGCRSRVRSADRWDCRRGCGRGQACRNQARSAERSAHRPGCAQDSFRSQVLRAARWARRGRVGHGPYRIQGRSGARSVLQGRGDQESFRNQAPLAARWARLAHGDLALFQTQARSAARSGHRSESGGRDAATARSEASGWQGSARYHAPALRQGPQGGRWESGHPARAARAQRLARPAPSPRRRRPTPAPPQHSSGSESIGSGSCRGAWRLLGS